MRLPLTIDVLRHRRCLLPFVGAFVILAACESETGGTDVFKEAVDPGARAHFLHHVVDEEAPGGRDCCSDVVAVGDLDGDGFGDVVVGGEHGSEPGLVWYQFPTWQRHAIGVGQFSTDGEVVDLDGDGDLDVVVGDTGAGIVWFENLGRAADWRRHVVGTGYAHDIAVADMDGDAHLDFVLASKKRLELWRATISGGFRSEVLSEQSGEGLSVVDLDGDGDDDLLYSNLWLEFELQDPGLVWSSHVLADGWPHDTRTQAADVNSDGRLDVVLSASEGEGRLAWFEADADHLAAPWRERPVGANRFVGAHSLAVADFDLNGRPDIAIAEMHTSPQRRIVVYFQESGTWREFLLAAHGSHNAVAADLDGDGDADLVGKNFGGTGRIVEFWENRAADFRLVPLLWPRTTDARAWTYQPLDSARPASDQQKFGLLVADVDLDGAEDVVSGGTLYLNPIDDNRADWPRVTVGEDLDAIDVTTQVVNGAHTILAVGQKGLFLAKRADAKGNTWEHRKLDSLPPGRTQGFAAGPARPDGGYDVFLTRGSTLLRVRVPDKAHGSFELDRISEAVDEAGVAIADLDSDGDTDIVTVAAGGRRLLWLESEPGDVWRPHVLGAGLHWFDRVAIVDIDMNGRLDIVYTEETRDWDFNARIGWLSAPTDRKQGNWSNHTVAVLRSVNSLDVHDVDGDGRPDLVVGEHTDMRSGQVAPDTLTGVMLNRGDDQWVFEPIEVGTRSNHMGTRVAHLDRGPLDVVSMGWEQSCCLMRWRRNDPDGTVHEVKK